uniref:Hedgehog protein n=2 Tax=Hirondellea gigas TaxID=1518452 RepID=A0A6A7FVX1_9CRUS
MWRDAVARACACALVLLLVRNTFVHCCGPGRGGARRRSTRKLMPLIFKEHVPNVYENTLGASGLTEGAITRDSSRFQDLVPNYNPDIIFRDDEGTGADRIMTERCKERLDTLAISVMNQWPGVRLRVKESWEEDHTKHSSHSLHYEGRAVDLATSDSDRSKYGMLARLAVEAGFDWVYYEARSHVHCSVKSESPALNRLGGCFPGASTVRTPAGSKPVSSLRQGELVEVMDSYGATTFSPALIMIHANPEATANFLQLTTQSSRVINITPSHLLMVITITDEGHHNSFTVADGTWNQSWLINNNNNTNVTHPQKFQASDSDVRTLVRTKFAGQVREGDFVLVERDVDDGLDLFNDKLVVGGNKTTSNLLVKGRAAEKHHSGLTLDRVVKVRGVEQGGVFAPLTYEGNVIIDGAVVSCYAIIDSQTLAHWSFLPVRVYYRIKDFILYTLETLRLLQVPDPHLDYETKVKGPSQQSQRKSKSVSPSPTHSNSINIHDQIEVEDVSIHWYPKYLYALAKQILPKHMLAS